MQPQHRARDDAKRAFGSQHQLLEIIARVVLEHLVETGDQRAICQHILQPEHHLAGHAIADNAVAAGIGRQIPPDLARTARAQIERDEKAGLVRRLLDHLKRRAGSYRDRGRSRVDLFHAGKTFEREHDRTGDRMPAAGQTGQPALRHHDHTVRGADTHGFGHTLGAVGAHHRKRTHRRQVAGVLKVARRDRIAAQQRARVERGTQCGQAGVAARRRQRGHLGHPEIHQRMVRRRIGTRHRTCDRVYCPRSLASSAISRSKFSLPTLSRLAS